jgi:tRNA U34 5-methylaminomethyl-2-thiouridine-forming methyltransferase MnmC
MNGIHSTPYLTADGSSTLRSLQFGAHYHSINGALTESEHIFIKYGLKALPFKKIDILEVGFGTGLNAALTAAVVKSKTLEGSYHGLELFPLTEEEYAMLNYGSILPEETSALWKLLCSMPWNQTKDLLPGFTILKQQCDFTKWHPKNRYHLIYFDAFAPDDQPEMWQTERFRMLYKSLHNGGLLVTYSVKGIVKNALKDAGFTLDRLQGPPGKRHMLRAWKR